MSGAALDILPYLHPLTYSQQLCHYRQGWWILKVTLLVPDRPSLCSFQVREWRKWETLKKANPAGSDRLARGDSPRAAGTHCRGYVTLACARWMRLLPGSHYLKKKKITALLTAENKRPYLLFRKSELEISQGKNQCAAKDSIMKCYVHLGQMYGEKRRDQRQSL